MFFCLLKINKKTVFFLALISTIYLYTLLPSINHSKLDLVMTKRYLVT